MTGAAPLVLFLHGFGSNEHDLASLAPMLPAGLAWRSLRAPLAMGGAGYMWFPLDIPNEPDSGAISSATDYIWDWLGENLSAETRIVPFGFSQGGLMALELLRTRPERVAATVLLSGLVAATDHDADARLAQERPPVFWGRGLGDQVIWPAAVARTAAWLENHADATVRVYPDLAHSVHAQEMHEVRAFLTAKLEAGPAF